MGSFEWTLLFVVIVECVCVSVCVCVRAPTNIEYIQSKPFAARRRLKGRNSRTPHHWSHTDRKREKTIRGNIYIYIYIYTHIYIFNIYIYRKRKREYLSVCAEITVKESARRLSEERLTN